MRNGGLLLERVRSYVILIRQLRLPDRTFARNLLVARVQFAILRRDVRAVLVIRARVIRDLAGAAGNLIIGVETAGVAYCFFAGNTIGCTSVVSRSCRGRRCGCRSRLMRLADVMLCIRLLRTVRIGHDGYAAAITAVITADVYRRYIELGLGMM